MGGDGRRWVTAEPCCGQAELRRNGGRVEAELAEQLQPEPKGVLLVPVCCDQDACCSNAAPPRGACAAGGQSCVACAADGAAGCEVAAESHARAAVWPCDHINAGVLWPTCTRTRRQGTMVGTCWVQVRTQEAVGTCRFCVPIVLLCAGSRDSTQAAVNDSIVEATTSSGWL